MIDEGPDYGPDAHDRRAAIARWQKFHRRLMRNAGFWAALTFGADRADYIRDAEQRYDRDAGEARARGEWVPTRAQLRVDAEGDNPWHP